MKILTKAIKEKLIANHKEQDGTKEFKAVLKLFNPTGIGTWYLSELDPETNNAFGLCCLTDEELGYVNLLSHSSHVHIALPLSFIFICFFWCLHSSCTSFSSLWSFVIFWFIDAAFFMRISPFICSNHFHKI